jgi:uncharacterized membrane protein
MPPIHPALVHFPIVLVTFSIFADLVSYFKDSPSARTVAWWSLIGAVLSAVPTVAAGFYDMYRADLNHETHKYVDLHRNTGLILLLALIGLTLWRWFIRTRPNRSIEWSYVTATILVFALTFFQGWLGGEMVYSYGAAVAPAGQGVESADQAKTRLKRLRRPRCRAPLTTEPNSNAMGSTPAEKFVYTASTTTRVQISGSTDQACN